MPEPAFRIRGTRSASRGGGLRIAHRHGERWFELTPSIPALTKDDREQHWRVVYRCATDCGEAIASEVPA
jgi:hypothetical protein